MQIGYIGLGKMGLNMVERLLEKNYDVVVFNKDIGPVAEAEKMGAREAPSIREMTALVEKTRLIWIMVPHTAVDDVLNELVPQLEAGDTVIDGGNSKYTDSIKRATELRKEGINFLDVGVSGGPKGAREGACLMIGGDEEKYKQHEQLFIDLSVPLGYGYMGESGSGHFVKMVHNGIEYGIMQSIAEGFAVMKKAPLDLDVIKISNLYNHGSVISSSLMEWMNNAYKEYGEELKDISGEVAHSGEGQWTVDEANKLSVPTPIIKGALEFRKESQGNPSYIGQIVSALRNQFGGHFVEKE